MAASDKFHGLEFKFALPALIFLEDRFRTGAERGEELPVRSAFVLLNAGVAVVGLGLCWGAPPAVILTGRLSEVAAVVAFAINAYPRVKAFAE